MRSLIIILFVLYGQLINASNVFPEPGRVYNDNEIPRVEISINPEHLSNLLDPSNVFLDDLYPAQFKWIDSQGIEVMDSVGFRLRGNTSRLSAKKSFKVKFKGFGGSEFYGLSDLNLNGEHNDPSVCRTKLAWDLYKQAGVPSPRSNHVELFINDEFYGLYMNVEHIDKDYLNVRYANPGGNLYKMTYGCDFRYLGTDPNNYKFGDPRVFELKTNEAQDDYSNLAYLMEVLNNISNPDYRCDLETIFDVDLYLRALALEVLIGHFDSPAFNQNNGYLYEDPVSGQIKYIPFDVDNTFGIIWGGTDMGNKNIYQWQWGNNSLRIYKMMMTVPEYRFRFGFYIDQFIGSFYNGSVLNNKLNELRSHLKPIIDEDKYYTYSYGYGPSDFWSSFNFGLGDHVPYGIKEFISVRSISAKTQLQGIDILPVFKEPSIGFEAESTVTVFCESFNQKNVELFYSIDGENWVMQEMNDKGQNGDVHEGDNYYSCNIEVLPGNTIYYYFEGITSSNRRSRFPRCENENFTTSYMDVNVTPIFINEVMASNRTITDNYDEYEDWVELYNPGRQLVLTDLYLSDDINKPDKWKISDQIIDEKGYYLIWADNDLNQGLNHANFKLNKGGEGIYLYLKKGEDFVIMDEVLFPELNSEHSYGRYPDGSDSFILMDLPTPSASNTNEMIISDEMVEQVKFYPNPTSDWLYHESDKEVNVLQVFDTRGNAVPFYQSDNGIDVGGLVPGVYLIYLEVNNELTYSKFVKI